MPQLDLRADAEIKVEIPFAQRKGELALAQIDHIQKVELAEDVIRQMHPVELAYTHYFSKGVYARQMDVPANSYVTGHIHKYTNLNILIKGRLTLMTENGQIEVSAPYIVVSPPGTKRIAFAHEDSSWITIHGTEETDIDKIEEMFIAHSYEEYLEFCASQEKERN